MAGQEGDPVPLLLRPLPIVENHTRLFSFKLIESYPKLEAGTGPLPNLRIWFSPFLFTADYTQSEEPTCGIAGSRLESNC